MKAKERRKTQYRYSVLDSVRATRKTTLFISVESGQVANNTYEELGGNYPRRLAGQWAERKVSAKKATRVVADKAAELERQREKQA